MINNGTVAFTGSQSTDPKLAGTLAWMAPELHCGEQVTFESDIYAFACVCYEVCLKVDSEFCIYERSRVVDAIWTCALSPLG